MPQKQIYLNQEIFNQSKEIPNFSELVATLFRDYLLTKKTKEELITEANKIQEQKDKLINELNQKQDKIIIEAKKAETTEQEQQHKEELKLHKLANNISDCMNNCKEIFNIEITSEEAEEYFKSNCLNLKDYLIKINKWK